MKAYFIKTTVIVLFLSASAFSCEKEDMKPYMPDCETGNCVSVNIKGSLIVKPSGEGLMNIPVVIFFRKCEGRIPVFCDERKVVSGKTNKNGEFDFRVKINPRSFKDYNLIVEIPEQKNYITTDRSASADKIIQYFTDFNEDALKKINFEFYKKAMLTINFIRTQTDYFDSFSCTISISGSRGLWGMNEESIKLTNGIVQLETVADVYTIINWAKYLNYNLIEYKSDSLICRQNSNNKININY